MNTIGDPFIYILNEISRRLKDELMVRFPKKHKLIIVCKSCSDKMQGYYYDWEKNMNATMDGLQKMVSFKKLIPFNSEIQTAITAFSETINMGREHMGEAKRNWSSKCKRVYKDLEVKNHGHEKVAENIIASAEIMAQGLKEIAFIAKDNYHNTRRACIDVFTQYNRAVKSISAKNKRKLSCARITITSKKIAAHIGQLPRH